jgi:hypothetical protein
MVSVNLKANYIPAEIRPQDAHIPGKALIAIFLRKMAIDVRTA